MAVIIAAHVLPTRGGYDSPEYAADLYRYGFIEHPYESEATRSPGGSIIVNNLPVDANSRVITGSRQRAYVDDYYYRIHIAPQSIDLGSVVSTQTVPLFVWNAHLTPQTLNAITGTDEGLIVGGQPNPPLHYEALQEREYQLQVTPDGQPVLDTRVVFDFGTEQPDVRVMANRIIAWAFVPDWSDGVTEQLAWATDILQSDSLHEQRRALRLAPRREFEASNWAEGRERQLLDLSLFGWGGRIWSLPLWHEIQLLSVGVPADSLFIPCGTQFLDFHPDGLALLRGESAFQTEVVEIETVLPNGLQLKRATQQQWPALSRLYPARTAQLLETPQLLRKTDQLQEFSVRFTLMDNSDVPAQMPATLYREHPVFEQRPEETEDLTASFERLQKTLDSGMSHPLTVDIGNRTLPVQSWRTVLYQREQRYRFRAFLYALNGRQKAVWLPTWADDLTITQIVSAGAAAITVANVGYTRFANGRTGRKDIRIELHNGQVFYRRIVGSAELNTEEERLAIDTALGVQIQPSEVAQVSWLALMRLDSDTVSIEHLTDSEGVARSQLIFRGVRDDDLS